MGAHQRDRGGDESNEKPRGVVTSFFSENSLLRLQLGKYKSFIGAISTLDVGERHSVAAIACLVDFARVLYVEANAH